MSDREFFLERVAVKAVYILDDDEYSEDGVEIPTIRPPFMTMDFVYECLNASEENRDFFQDLAEASWDERFVVELDDRETGLSYRLILGLKEPLGAS